MPTLIQEKLDNDWIVNILPSISAGMNTSKEPWLIEDDECQLLRNARPHKGTLRVDTGYRTVLDTAAVLGTPRRTFEHVFADGNRETILVTDSTVYKLTSASGWYLISGGFTTTINEVGGISIGETVWTVTTATFGIGDVIGLVLDADAGGIIRHHVTTVTGVAGFDVTVLTGPPAPAANGNSVIRGLRRVTGSPGGLQGTSDHEVVMVGTEFTSTAQNAVAVTNGVNAPFYYDGNTVQQIPNLPNAGVTVCRTLWVHTHRLCLGGILSDGGAAHPEKVYWSGIGNLTDWSGPTAGFESLRDERDAIVAGLPMQEHVVIYRLHSIVRMEFMETDYTGNAGAGSALEFFFRTMVAGHSQGIGVGATSANAVINYNNVHYVMARDGIYAYTGGFQVDALSTKVDKGYFTDGPMADKLKRHRDFAFYVDERNELFFCFAAEADGGTYPKRALVFNSDEQAWWERKFSHEITAGEVHLSTAGISWDELVGTWDDQQWTWDQLSGSANRWVFLCSNSGNLVFQYDFNAGSDNGTPIAYEVDTKVWRTYDRIMRWEWWQFEYSGMPAIQIGVDETEVYLLVANVSSLPYFRRRYGLTLQGESFQLVFTGSGANFVLSQAMWLARQESRWVA